MITVRKSKDRGHVNIGWLDSHHSFSFGSYHDPAHMGFGHLRVINQDVVQPGRGFATHGHRNMEIISYVLDGLLAHSDSTGNSGVIRPGEVQVMSAGTGIRHSEMNESEERTVQFLQIWVLPSKDNTEPGYAQKAFPAQSGLSLLVSPDGRAGSLSIRQDMELYRVLMKRDDTIRFNIKRGRAWVQLMRGSLQLGDLTLQPGDGAAITQAAAIQLSALDEVEALVFDLV